jgi:hypothetical protein
METESVTPDAYSFAEPFMNPHMIQLMSIRKFVVRQNKKKYHLIFQDKSITKSLEHSKHTIFARAR